MQNVNMWVFVKNAVRFSSRKIFVRIKKYQNAYQDVMLLSDRKEIIACSCTSHKSIKVCGNNSKKQFGKKLHVLYLIVQGW